MDRLSTTALLPDTFQGTRDDITEQLGVIWEQMKAPVIVPLLRLSVLLCLIMSVMLLAEKVYMAIVIVLVKLFGRGPHKQYRFEPISDDLELGNSAYPMVLVQIPMYNEREVLPHNYYVR
jgi:beta-mannan synthase